MSLEQAIGELVKSNDAMAQSMEKKAGEINNALSQQELKVADYLAGARLEAPFYRLTKNQYGNLADGLLEHYSINSAFPITFEVHRTITSGVNWALRDAEEQEILTAMGLGGGQSFIPSIPIIKMSWSGYTGVFPGNHTFYQLVPGSVSSTTACYAKLLEGGIDGYGFSGINGEWGLCGMHMAPIPCTYAHQHPAVSTGSGSVLFALHGSVAGKVPLDRKKPKWGFYPHISASSATDISI